MKITAYPSYRGAATLRPASRKRSWQHVGDEIYVALALASANGKGFDLLCPHAFEATWQGGPKAEDIDLRVATGDASLAFVQSLQGEGLLTFYPGHQFKTESGQALWVRGPVNAPKDGIAPLEIVIDPSVVPGTFTMHWQFTRPGQTVRFAAGEPFCTVFPYAKEELEEAAVEILGGDGYGEVSREVGEAAFLRLIDESAVAQIFQHLRAPASEAPPKSESPESEPPRSARRWATRSNAPACWTRRPRPGRESLSPSIPRSGPSAGFVGQAGGGSVSGGLSVPHQRDSAGRQ